MSAVMVIDTSTMQRISGQLGSNPAAIYQHNNGRRYYVKTLESLAHARNEFIAAKLYQLAGAPTLTYLPTTDSKQIATEWQNLDKKCVAHLSLSERKQAQQWFAVHAWMANWDVAGFNGDNQGVVNGIVITLDVGGALNFRALGDPKGNAFSSYVGELSTLREDKHNPYALSLFGAMSLKEIKQSISVVVAIPDQYIRQIIIDNGGHRKLVDKMIARKAFMANLLK